MACILTSIGFILCVYTMKIEAENSGPSQLFCFKGIPVYWGSGFEEFHCITNMYTCMNTLS